MLLGMVSCLPCCSDGFLWVLWGNQEQQVLAGNGKLSPLLFWWVSVGVVAQSGAVGACWEW